MVECKSHASVTARKIVGHISHKIEHQTGSALALRRPSAATTASTSALASVTGTVNKFGPTAQLHWRRPHRHWQRGKRAAAAAAAAADGFSGLAATGAIGGSTASAFSYTFEPLHLSGGGSHSRLESANCSLKCSSSLSSIDDQQQVVIGTNPDWNSTAVGTTKSKRSSCCSSSKRCQYNGRNSTSTSQCRGSAGDCEPLGDGDGAQLSITGECNSSLPAAAAAVYGFSVAAQASFRAIEAA